MGTKAVRRDSQSHREGCEDRNSPVPELPWAQLGSSSVPLQGSVRGHSALRDSQVPQGWDSTVTRARQLFVTPPLQVLPCENCSASNNIFTDPTALWTPAHHSCFHPLSSQSSSGSLVSIFHRWASSDSELHSLCVSAYTTHPATLLPLPKQWDVL